MSRNRSWLVVVAVIGILLGLVLTAFCGRVNSDYFEICSSPGREKSWDRIAENFPVFSLSSASHVYGWRSAEAAGKPFHTVRPYDGGTIVWLHGIRETAIVGLVLLVGAFGILGYCAIPRPDSLVALTAWTAGCRNLRISGIRRRRDRGRGGGFFTTESTEVTEKRGEDVCLNLCARLCVLCELSV